MENYTNKKKAIKVGQFAALDFIPNKLVYITKKDSENIYFLFFNKENGETEMSAKKSSISVKIKKEFKTLPECFYPSEKISELIKK